MTRTALATFGREEVKIKHGENEEKSAGKLVVPSFPDEKMSEERGPSGQEEIESEMTRREKTVNRKRRWKRILTKREKTTTRRQQVVCRAWILISWMITKLDNDAIENGD